MITLISGKPNSGKSLRAEELAISCGGPLIYLATMKVMDEEGRIRVRKHRMQREGKGFITIEHPYALRDALGKIEEAAGYGDGAADTPRKYPLKATVLLECVANLVGNELYDNPARPWHGAPQDADPNEFVSTVTEDIRCLSDHVSDLIAVTSEYDPYEGADPATLRYIEILNKVNLKLLTY